MNHTFQHPVEREEKETEKKNEQNLKFLEQ
jgi:hypothetical protein